MKTIQLGVLKLPVLDYAIQGNAILGIKESGKTYTATTVAEQLMDARIPIIAFDNVGVWKWLKVGRAGHAGYPVVVAGGKAGDFPITSLTAPEIIRAARRTGVSLVVDLHDRALSHAERGRIVAACVEVLLYENEDWGLCHVFFEEAARWVPQVVRGDNAKVYSAVESFCQMGGNSRVGYTLIGQRAESLNKEVLELCDLLILGRQKGRNSLTALGKWLDIGEVTDSRAIAKTLPTLPTSEFWIWPSASVLPQRVKMQQKHTVHPDRRALALHGEARAYKPLDVKSFVAQMSVTLETVVAEAKANDPAELRRQVADLKKQLAAAAKAAPVAPVVERVEVPVFKDGEVKRLEDTVEGLDDLFAQLIAAANEISSALRAATTSPTPRRASTPVAASPSPLRTLLTQPVSRPAPPRPGSRPPAGDESDVALTRSKQAILDALAKFETVGITTPRRELVAFLAGASPKSSEYTKNLSRLVGDGLLNYPGSKIVSFTDAGRARATAPTAALTVAELLQAVLARLSRPRAAIVQCLVNHYPDSVLRQTIAEESGASVKSSEFTKNLSRLRALGLLDYAGSNAARALPHLFLE